MIKNLTKLFFILLLMSFFIIGCSSKQKSETSIKNGETKIQTQQNEAENMKLTSTAFVNNGAIPSEFTCDGADLSPQLIISDVPKNAKSLALIMDDPDAPIGTFVHWVAWNIPPSIKEVSKGTEPSGNLGMTGFRRAGYGGPCPPSGTHRYFFRLYALDTQLNLPEGSNKKDLEMAMESHILEKAELMGTYKRVK